MIATKQLNLTIDVTCPICGKASQVTVNSDDWFDWKFNKVVAQKAFPYLDDDQRELVMTGICEECW